MAGTQTQARDYLTAADLQTPLLADLSDMAARFANIRLLIVFPKLDGWGQMHPGESSDRPSFCRMIQGSKTGAKHCRMCHVLMSIAACSDGLTEQNCHAGASSLVTPIGEDESDCFAVLSTCVYARTAETEEAMRDLIHGQAEKLGVDPIKLFTAFAELPELTKEQVALGRSIMAATGAAVEEIAVRVKLERRLAGQRRRPQAAPSLQELVEQQLRDYIIIPGSADGNDPQREKNCPPVIEAVAMMVDQRPNMPFRVSEIAAAARVTPNHFSAMFRQCMDQSFLQYLTDKRMQLAKKLLGDLTQNVTEVALATGYDDPGYFSRVFRKQTGVSPREWRDKNVHNDTMIRS